MYYIADSSACRPAEEAQAAARKEAKKDKKAYDMYMYM